MFSISLPGSNNLDNEFVSCILDILSHVVPSLSVGTGARCSSGCLLVGTCRPGLLFCLGRRGVGFHPFGLSRMGQELLGSVGVRDSMSVRMQEKSCLFNRCESVCSGVYALTCCRGTISGYGKVLRSPHFFIFSSSVR